MPKSPQLSDAEWDVMKALWEQSPISFNDLCSRLTLTTEWHHKTIRTRLVRPASNRLVGNKTTGTCYHYAPLASREYCTRFAAHSFICRVFDGALTPMVAHFASRHPLTADEKRELRKLLADSA